MNEEGTPIESTEPEEVSTENISAEDGGVTTTPEEVAELLHLKPQTAATDEDAEEEDGSDDDAEEADSEADDAEAPDTPPAKADKEEADEAPEAPTDAPSFDLEVEDANGEKIVIKPGDDLEKVLADFEPKNNGQIFKILQDLGKKEQEQAKYNEAQEETAAETEKAAKVAEIRKSWDNEIASMQGSKRIPVTVEGKSNDRVEAVFKFMNEENTKRLEDGRPLLQSFEDTLDKLELQESRAEAATKAKEEKELAKKRGGLVGGSSAPASSGGAAYKGGARNANEALRAMGVL